MNAEAIRESIKLAQEVYNVLGSVKAWVAAGFPVTID